MNGMKYQSHFFLSSIIFCKIQRFLERRLVLNDIYLSYFLYSSATVKPFFFLHSRAFLSFQGIYSTYLFKRQICFKIERFYILQKFLSHTMNAKPFQFKKSNWQSLYKRYSFIKTCLFLNEKSNKINLVQFDQIQFNIICDSTIQIKCVSLGPGICGKHFLSFPQKTCY